MRCSPSWRIGDFTIQLNNRKLMRGFFEGAGHRRRRAAGGWCCAKSTSSTSAATTPCATTLAGEGFGLAAEAVDAADRLRRRCVRPATPMRWRSWTRWAQGNDAVRRRRAPSCAKCWSWCRRSACRRSHYALNLSIARGLDYYTGTVYETTLDAHPQIGSICSGGRYDEPRQPLHASRSCRASASRSA